MRSLLTQVCQKRVSSFKKCYVNENRNYIDYDVADQNKPRDAIDFGKGMPVALWDMIKLMFSNNKEDQKCKWLCLPSGELPIFMEQYFHEVAVALLAEYDPA